MKLFSYLLAFSLLTIAGCATRTSPNTVLLQKVKQYPAEHAELPKDTIYSVAIRFPAGFECEAAKDLFVQKVKLMATINKNKRAAYGQPLDDVSLVNFDPDEMIAKSFQAALQLRTYLVSNSQIRPFLMPMMIGTTNDLITLSPARLAPPQHLQIDVCILNPLVQWPNTPYIYWQGNNFGRAAAPMVRISAPETILGATRLLAGTRRWMDQNGNEAIVLPGVIERRYKSISGGSKFNYSRNYPIMGPKSPMFTTSKRNRPADLETYLEFDSFLIGKESDYDVAPYWKYVSAVTTDILALIETPSNSLIDTYIHEISANASESQRSLINRFIDAELTFVSRSDDTVVQRLDEINWNEHCQSMLEAEEEVIHKVFKAEKRQLYMTIVGSLVMGAVAGAGTAIAGEPVFNQSQAVAMGMDLGKALSAATDASTRQALNIYSALIGDTTISLSSTTLGLSEEAGEVTFTTLEQIREYARKMVGTSN